MGGYDGQFVKKSLCEIQAARAALGTKAAVFLLLTRFHADTDTSDPDRDQHPSWCYLSASLAHNVLGISRQSLKGALDRIAATAILDESGNPITDEHGNPYPAIVQVKKGHNGNSATYADNVYALVKGYPLTTSSAAVGKRFRFPTGDRVGKRLVVPTQEQNDRVGKRFRESRETFPCLKGNGSVSPQEIQEIQEITGGALLAPKQSEAPHSVNLPTEQQATSTPLVSGGGAALGAHATTSKPRLYHGMSNEEVEAVTWDDWLPVNKKVLGGAFDQLTADEKRTYSAGHLQGFTRTYNEMRAGQCLE